jgi:hypothetical protein
VEKMDNLTLLIALVMGIVFAVGFTVSAIGFVLNPN